MNTTSFLLSQLRSTLAATANSTSAAFTSIKTSLGFVVGAKTGRDDNNRSNDSAASSSAPSNVDYSREVEALKHEQYPSLQPWRGLDRRIKNYGYTLPISSNYTAPRHPIVLCHGKAHLFVSFERFPLLLFWWQAGQ